MKQSFRTVKTQIKFHSKSIILITFGLFLFGVVFLLSYAYLLWTTVFTVVWPVFWIPAGMAHYSIAGVMGALYEQAWKKRDREPMELRQFFKRLLFNKWRDYNWRTIFIWIGLSSVWGPYMYFLEVQWIIPGFFGEFLGLSVVYQSIFSMLIFEPLSEPLTYVLGRRVINRESWNAIIQDGLENKVMKFVGLAVCYWSVAMTFVLATRTMIPQWVFAVYCMSSFLWNFLLTTYIQGGEKLISIPKPLSWVLNVFQRILELTFGRLWMHRWFVVQALSVLILIKATEYARAAHLLFANTALTWTLIGISAVAYLWWLAFRSHKYIAPKQDGAFPPRKTPGIQDKSPSAVPTTWNAAASQMIAMAKIKARRPDIASGDVVNHILQGTPLDIDVGEIGSVSRAGSAVNPNEFSNILVDSAFLPILKARVDKELADAPTLQDAGELVHTLYSMGIPQGTLDNLTGDVIIRARGSDEAEAERIKSAVMRAHAAQSVTIWTKDGADEAFYNNLIEGLTQGDESGTLRKMSAFTHTSELFQEHTIMLNQLEENVPPHLREHLREHSNNLCLVFFEAMNCDGIQEGANLDSNLELVRIMILDELLASHRFVTLRDWVSLEKAARILARQA